MAIIKPFRAVRPAKNYVDMVAELPYDVMNREEAKKMGKENKYSFYYFSPIIHIYYHICTPLALFIDLRASKGSYP